MSSRVVGIIFASLLLLLLFGMPLWLVVIGRILDRVTARERR